MLNWKDCMAFDMMQQKIDRDRDRKESANAAAARREKIDYCIELCKEQVDQGIAPNASLNKIRAGINNMDLTNAERNRINREVNKYIKQSGLFEDEDDEY